MEDFLAQHPEHAGADEVALTIARIDHEHAERLALEEQRQGLLKKKQGLIADNKKRKDDLANLDKDLEKFIDVRLMFRLAGIKLMCYHRPRNQSRRPSRKLFEETRLRYTNFINERPLPSGTRDFLAKAKTRCI